VALSPSGSARTYFWQRWTRFPPATLATVDHYGGRLCRVLLKGLRFPRCRQRRSFLKNTIESLVMLGHSHPVSGPCYTAEPFFLKLHMEFLSTPFGNPLWVARRAGSLCLFLICRCLTRASSITGFRHQIDRNASARHRQRSPQARNARGAAALCDGRKWKIGFV
jgi:hypothetical protein